MKKVWIGTRRVMVLAQNKEHEKKLIDSGYPFRMTEKEKGRGNDSQK